MDNPENVENLIQHALDSIRVHSEIERLLKYLPGGEIYESRLGKRLEEYFKEELEEI